MPNKQRIFIYDWAGNAMQWQTLDGADPMKGFKTVQDAHDFTTEYLREKFNVSDEKLDVELGEYQYIEKAV